MPSYVPRRAPQPDAATFAAAADARSTVSEIAYVALGSNLGDRRGQLEKAVRAIAAIPCCRIVATSSIEETAPLGGMDQPPYLNQMVAVDTSLEPTELLAHLQRIEREAGRERTTRWAARELDLDIVLFDEREVNDEDLTIPHPGLADREFWRRELSELGRQP